MPFFKYLYIFTLLFLVSPLSSQTIDPEALRAILDESGEGQQAQGESFESFTQNNYSQTLSLLEALDKEEEKSLFYQSLMQSRIELVSQLCSKDPRACYLIDEYRDMKFLEVPETINDLKLFGLDAFIGYPINLDSFNELPLPDDYRIKVGDQLTITINGIKPFQSDSQISPMGNLSIPGFGIYELAGLNLNEAITKLTNEIQLSYPGSEIALTLNQIKPKKVFVLGNVLNPGSYGVNAFATAINALITSGGLQPNSSLRNLIVNSKNQPSKSIDLYDFLINGKTDSDVILNDGDTVLVNGLQEKAYVLGEVNRPAIYEIKDGETVKDLLNFALGFTDLADQESITLHRRNTLGQSSTIQVANEDIESFRLQSGDRIIVNALAGESLDDVVIYGAVRNPGSFSYSSEAVLSNYINFNTDLLDETYTLMGVIKRFNKKIRAWNFIKFDLLNAGTASNTLIKPRDRIYVFSREDIEFLSAQETTELLGLTGQSGLSESNNMSDESTLLSSMQMDQAALQARIQETDALNNNKKLPVCLSSFKLDKIFTAMINLKLSAFDYPASSNKSSITKVECPTIFLNEPELFPFAMVQAIPVVGNVRLPSLYPISNEITPKQVFDFAGGTMFGSADSNSFHIVHEQNSLRLSFNELATIKNIKFFNARQLGALVKQGYVTLHGEVKFPGKYSISEGETISSIYKRAGGLTAFSYPLGGILTRESVKENQKKVLIKAQKDLGEVLSSAAMNGYLNQNPTDLVQLISLISSLSESDGLGRIVAELDPIKINKDPNLDIMLEEGDSIFIPKLNSTVTIVGSVLNPITVPYNNGFNAKDYLKLAGGYSKTADKGSTYIIFPNGVSKKLNNNLFSFVNSDNPVPGSTIIVPRRATNLDTMGLLKFATPILADLSVTAASINAISN